MNYNDLYHFGVLGMKWGVRKKRESSSGGRISRRQALKQQRIKRRQNYKLVSNRIKEAGISKSGLSLMKYETGELSRSKIKRYLGKDISVKQVDNYIKDLNKRANIGMIIGAVAGTGLAIAYTQLRK